MSIRPLLLAAAVLASCSPPEDEPKLDRVVQWSDGDNTSAQDISITANGQLYTASYGRPDGRYRSSVRLHSPSGEPLWTGTQDPELDSMARGVHAMADGSVLLATQAKLNHDSNQQFVWMGRYQPGSSDRQQVMRLDYWDGPAEYSVPSDSDARDDGTVAVVGHGMREDEVVMLHRSGGSTPSFSVRLAEGFEEQRGGFVALSDENTAVGFNSGSNALGDRNGGDFDAWVTMVDSNGVALWTDHIAGPGRQGVHGGTTDAEGRVYVCGASEDLDDGRGGADVFVRAYDADGSILWTQSLGTAWSDACVDVDLSGDDTLLLAGYQGHSEHTAAQGLVAALDADTGAVRWQTAVAPKVAGATFLFGVDSFDDDVFVVGQTAGSFVDDDAPPTHQAMLARLSSEGILASAP